MDFREVLLVLHILLAIIWAGGVLFIGWGVFPAFRKMAFVQQRTFLQALMQWSHKFLTAAGGGVVITGVLLGTVFGPISQWQDMITTRYGLIWITALVIGIVTLLWGTVVGFRQSARLFSKVTLWKQADAGNTKPLTKALAAVVLLESAEGVGFAALVVLMVLF
ncbi:hypothetical protein [Lentibacillus kimchii]|uniref:Copper resistance protein D domain-containing protein n=1 Tax=Lentibacillus kimchii TaxID=1542911 RepID=A0ABW2UUB3_9BACI